MSAFVKLGVWGGAQIKMEIFFIKTSIDIIKFLNNLMSTMFLRIAIYSRINII